MSNSEVLTLTSDQGYFIRVLAKHIRALVIGSPTDPWWKLYIDGCPTAFLITEASARQVSTAQDGIL